MTTSVWKKNFPSVLLGVIRQDLRKWMKPIVSNVRLPSRRSVRGREFIKVINCIDWLVSAWMPITWFSPYLYHSPYRQSCSIALPVIMPEVVTKNHRICHGSKIYNILWNLICPLIHHSASMEWFSWSLNKSNCFKLSASPVVIRIHQE